MVNEPSVFEPLKFYCIYLFYTVFLSYETFAITQLFLCFGYQLGIFSVAKLVTDCLSKGGGVLSHEMIKNDKKKTT